MKYTLKKLNPDNIWLGTRFRQEYQTDDLVASIEKHGVLQPITVAPFTPEPGSWEEEEGKKYVVLAGGRRYMSVQEIGLKQIPCLVRENTEELDLREIEYIENYHRKDPTWQEKMALVVEIQRLMQEKHGEKWQQRDTAKMLDKALGGVNRVLSLSKMCDQFPKLLEEKTEDDAVTKSRKFLEAVVVKHLEKKHTAAAKEAGITDEGDIPTAPGEDGEESDTYISVCRKASQHFIIGDAIAQLENMIQNGDQSPAIFIEVDPPYAIDLKKQKKSTSKELEEYEEITQDDYPVWTDTVVRRLFEVSPDDCRMVYWFGIEWYQMVKDALDRNGWKVDPIPALWIKPSGQTNNPDLYLARAYEPFFVCSKGEGVPINQRGRTNVFEFNPVPAARKYHPTQRPVELIREILRTFSWPNSVVLCPFLGSGATLRAAYSEHMVGYGWELNVSNKPKFLAAVEKDIEDYKTIDPDDTSADDIPF